MWKITDKNGQVFDKVGNDGMTLTQVIAELIFFDCIQSIDDIREIICYR